MVRFLSLRTKSFLHFQNSAIIEENHVQGCVWEVTFDSKSRRLFLSSLLFNYLFTALKLLPPPSPHLFITRRQTYWVRWIWVWTYQISLFPTYFMFRRCQNECKIRYILVPESFFPRSVFVGEYHPEFLSLPKDPVSGPKVVDLSLCCGRGRTSDSFLPTHEGSSILRDNEVTMIVSLSPPFSEVYLNVTKNLSLKTFRGHFSRSLTFNTTRTRTSFFWDSIKEYPVVPPVFTRIPSVEWGVGS